jgi:hypothetical protein
MPQPEPVELDWLAFVQVTVITDARGLMNAPCGLWATILARSVAGAPWFQALAQTLAGDWRDAFDAAVNARANTTDDAKPTRTMPGYVSCQRQAARMRQCSRVTPEQRPWELSPKVCAGDGCPDCVQLPMREPGDPRDSDEKGG